MPEGALLIVTLGDSLTEGAGEEPGARGSYDRIAPLWFAAIRAQLPPQAR